MAINKMHESRSIMRQIIKDETVALDGRRKAFIQKAMTELGMTKSMASSYYHIVKTSMVDGKDGYASHKRANRRVAEQQRTDDGDTVETPEVVVPTAEDVSEPVSVDVSKRWQIEDKDTKSIVDAFTSRSAAQAAVKTRKDNGENVRWVDGEKRTA